MSNTQIESLFREWWNANQCPGRDRCQKLLKQGKIKIAGLNQWKIREFLKKFKEEGDTNDNKSSKKGQKTTKELTYTEREFSEEELQITHLKNQLRVKESEIRKLQNIAASDLAIVKLFEEALGRFKPHPTIITNKKKTKDDEEIVILLSDIHYGEVVSSEAMLDSNCYDAEIAEKRLNIWYNNIRTILNKLDNYNIKKINLMMLGDMVSGMIHEELKSGTCEVDQVLNLSEIIANIIFDLSKDYRLDVAGVIGNHGRMTKKPSFKKKYNNFDYLVYKFIETRCQNLNNVRFEIPKAGMMLKEIQGYNFLLRHGDAKVQSFAGIPFYGIQRASNKITQTIAHLKDIFIHYEVLGHFHTSNVLEKVGGSIILNGTMKGGDEYALESMLTTSEAKQTIFGVHRNYGTTWRFDVHCNK